MIGLLSAGNLLYYATDTEVLAVGTMVAGCFVCGVAGATGAVQLTAKTPQQSTRYYWTSTALAVLLAVALTVTVVASVIAESDAWFFLLPTVGSMLCVGCVYHASRQAHNALLRLGALGTPAPPTYAVAVAAPQYVAPRYPEKAAGASAAQVWAQQHGVSVSAFPTPSAAVYA